MGKVPDDTDRVLRAVEVLIQVALSDNELIKNSHNSSVASACLRVAMRRYDVNNGRYDFSTEYEKSSASALLSQFSNHPVARYYGYGTGDAGTDHRDVEATRPGGDAEREAG